MNLSPEAEEIILKMDLEELWNEMNRLHYTYGMEIEDEYRKIKSGINLAFDIRYPIKGWVSEDNKNKKAHFRGLGHFDLYKYWDEIDSRTAMMRNIALSHLKDEDFIIPAGLT